MPHGAAVPSAQDAPDAAGLIAARPWLRAHAHDGLVFDGVSLANIARIFGTPCWVTSADTLRARLQLLRAAMPGVAIHYAVKANDHLAVLAVLAREGAGADVVSGGELRRCLRAGMPPGRIVFSGVGKTRAEMALALSEGIAQINVESVEELHALASVAQAMGRTARIALRINPDVDAQTHAKISTGRAGDKFGIPLREAAHAYALASRLEGVAPVGLAVHIGSQVGGAAPFAAAYKRLAGLVNELRGQGLPVAMADCGGGLGYPYAGEAPMLPQAWAATLFKALGGLGLDLAIEPGRWLAAPAGLLLASVIRTRRAGLARPIVVLDAGMNDLARPALYDAWHGILPITLNGLAGSPELVDIAGPVCESSDFFGRARWLAPLEEGAPVAILDCGAYGAVMSSTYNARPAAGHVLIDSTLDCGMTCIRQRVGVDDLWSGETIPVWPG